MAIYKQKKLNERFIKPKVAIEHTGFYQYLQRYNEQMGMRNYSEVTLHRRDSDLRRFFAWCEARSLNEPKEITKAILENYQQYLFYYRQDNDKPLSPTTRNHYINSVKALFKWLAQENYLAFNPAADIVPPRPMATRLPIVLSEGQVEHLLQQPDLTTLQGLRDKAILELFYATGLRRLELCRLGIRDLVMPQQVLYVRKGKGGKDRVLPMGERAHYWVERYLTESRPKLIESIHEEAVFINNYGNPYRDNKLGDLVTRYLKKAHIKTDGSCHLLRHAMATHMMENGAELRYIQVMLGHADLSSTQIYAHVTINKLREIHSATHPSKLKQKLELINALIDEDEDEE
jgi:integrase/recombinase XerD